MKDGDSQGGCGTIVGFLKVGYKKLFLLDQQGLHKEAEPLCVLDFFISENLQRNGYGLQLFNFMLQHKSLDPVLMAYDRPSPKLLSFLAKHYRLTQIVPQVNHFVVFDGFFINKSGSSSCPLMDQGIYSFFGPIENNSPKKARQRDQTLFHNGKRSCASGAEEPSVAVCHSPISPAVGILPVLPQYGILPHQAAPSVHHNVCPWATQEPESKLSPIRTIQGKRHKGQVARGGLYSRHMDNKSFESLGGPLSGLRFKGDQPQFLGHTETYKLASDPSPESRLLTHSDPSTNKGQNNKNLHRGTNVEMANAKLECLPSKVPRSTTRQFSENNKHLLVKEQDRERIGLSWTVGKSCFSAQQVKQTLLSRSTCPW
ncbi:alpha-tubulin N-acetyltransferase 1 isoform X3 [Stigmatopora nigra]